MIDDQNGTNVPLEPISSKHCANRAAIRLEVFKGHTKFIRTGKHENSMTKIGVLGSKNREKNQYIN